VAAPCNRCGVRSASAWHDLLIVWFRHVEERHSSGEAGERRSFWYWRFAKNSEDHFELCWQRGISASRSRVLHERLGLHWQRFVSDLPCLLCNSRNFINADFRPFVRRFSSSFSASLRYSEEPMKRKHDAFDFSDVWYLITIYFFAQSVGAGNFLYIFYRNC